MGRRPRRPHGFTPYLWHRMRAPDVPAFADRRRSRAIRSVWRVLRMRLHLLRVQPGDAGRLLDSVFRLSLGSRLRLAGSWTELPSAASAAARAGRGNRRKTSHLNKTQIRNNHEKVAYTPDRLGPRGRGRRVFRHKVEPAADEGPGLLRSRGLPRLRFLLPLMAG
jgi:hypothetical protein